MGKKRPPKGGQAKQQQQTTTDSSSCSPQVCTTWKEHSFLAVAALTNVNPAHLLKGPEAKAHKIAAQLEALASTFTNLATAPPTAADVPHAVACSNNLAVLLLKLLAARKRAREWKQAAYSTSVASVLEASVILLAVAEASCPNWHPITVGVFDIRGRVVAAMVEVTQLLSQSADPSQHQQQQQSLQAAQQQLQQQLLVRLGHALLQWCCRGDSLEALDTYNGVSLQLRAVELAAVLAAHVPAPTPTMPSRTAIRTVVLHVMDRVYAMLLGLVDRDPQETGPFVMELYASPAFLQTTLALVLLLSACMCSSSTSSGGSSGGSSDASSSGGGSVSVSSSSSGGPGAAAAKQEGPVLPWGQRMPAGFSQLWRAAGLAPGSWATWVGLGGLTEPHDDLLPDTVIAAGERHAKGDKAQGGGSSSSSSSSNSNSNSTLSMRMFAFKTLPEDNDDDSYPDLQGFVVVTQVLTKCITYSICQYPELDLLRQDSYSSSLRYTKHSEKLGRQHKQVLQAVLGPLPGFLLRVVGLHGYKQQPLVAELAAAAAWCCCTAWQAPGLQLGAIAAAAAAGGEGGSGGVSSSGGTSTAAAAAAVAAAAGEKSPCALLQGVLDAWLVVMQQQLLQQPYALLRGPIAANADEQERTYRNDAQLSEAGSNSSRRTQQDPQWGLSR